MEFSGYGLRRVVLQTTLWGDVAGKFDFPAVRARR